MQLTRQLVALLAGTFLYAGFTRADDYWIPEWRGQPGTVCAVWDNWIDYPQSMPPDRFSANPASLALPGATADPERALLMDSWTDELGANHWNVLHITGDNALGFRLDNFDRNWPEKRVWIQITFDSDQTMPAGFSVTAGYPDEVVTKYIPVELVGTTEPPGWVTAAYEFHLQPNPLWEEIMFQFAWQGADLSKHSAFVDQVVIDTFVGAEFLPGDFDFNGSVDGADFLIWQRGDLPEPLSGSDLADWQANFGTVILPTTISAAVPEPAAWPLLMLGLAAALFYWRIMM